MLEIKSIDSDFCEIIPVRVMYIDVRSMLECGPAPMICYAHAIALFFNGTVRQTCYDLLILYFFETKFYGYVTSICEELL